LWETIRGDLVYGFNQINYYKIVNDKAISDVRIQFKIKNIRSESEFELEAALGDKPGTAFKYSVHSRKEAEELTDKFLKDLKMFLPLKGVILKREGLYLNANIGRYFDVQKGDIFFIVDNKDINKIKGIAVVMESFNHYSRCLVTSYNQLFGENDLLVPFYYKKNLKYHLFSDPVIHKKLTKPYKFEGLFGLAYFTSASKGKYIFIADEKEAGIFISGEKRYEKIDNINFNSISKAEFDRGERYFLSIRKNGELNIFILNGFYHYILRYDGKEEVYKFILYEEKNIYDLETVQVDDCTFYDKDHCLFFDRARTNVISINIKNNQFKKISLSQPINKVLKILISPNNKKLLILTDKHEVLIKDLTEDMDEVLLKDIDDIKVSRTGVYLICKKEKELILHDLYTQIHKNFNTDTPFDMFLPSYSERYIAYVQNSNPNSINILDVQENVILTDVFENIKEKRIMKIDRFFDDGFLLYGKLFDIDENKKLDHRDLNDIVYLDFLTGRHKVLLNNVDSFFGLSNFTRYILYGQKKKLYLKDFNYEEISK